MRHVSIWLALTLGLTTVVQAETWHLDLGLGGGGYRYTKVHDDFTYTTTYALGTIGGAISRLHGNREIALRYLFCQHLTFDYIDEPFDTIHELGWLYGIAESSHEAHYSASIGLSIVHGRSCRSAEFTTIGIPLELELSKTVFRGFGIGIQNAYNLNLESSFAVLLLRLKFGLW